jgi:porin
VALLQFDGQPTNRQAGIITGYNSLTGAPPLDRTELYELWWRQSFFSDQLVLRIGKTVPTYDFGNVVRPVPVQDLLLRIPVVGFTTSSRIFRARASVWRYFSSTGSRPIGRPGSSPATTA